MFRIKVWIPVEIDPDEDTKYTTRGEAQIHKEHMEMFHPGNIYEIEEVNE